MTSKEIMGADLLDILFENRNKDYGAYALRRTYNHRLLLAMGATLSIIPIFMLIQAISRKDFTPSPEMIIGPAVQIQDVKPPKPVEPEIQIQAPKKLENLATIKYVSLINIKPAIDLKKAMSDISELNGRQISDITKGGNLFDNISRPVQQVQPGEKNGDESAGENKEFFSQQPEFPGGPDALRRFLANNLSTPEDLDVGEKKMVRIRFAVGADGVITNLEITNSGGLAFDREVIRVCKKMPRWKPAIQSGVNVAVSYILPVTFIGVEQ